MGSTRVGTGGSGGLLRPSVSARANGSGSAGINGMDDMSGMGGSMASGSYGEEAPKTNYKDQMGSLPGSSPSPSTQMNSQNPSAFGNSNGGGGNGCGSGKGSSFRPIGGKGFGGGMQPNNNFIFI